MAKSIVYHLIVVGCGGTGGFFIKEFGRFMARNRNYILMTLIDGDTVESHNLDRQSFQEEDIGLPKSTILAEALTSCLGLPQSRVSSYPCYIETTNQLSGIVMNAFQNFADNQRNYMSSYHHLPILIGCVDNHAARRVLHDYYKRFNGNIFYYDAANEFSHGEVVFAGRSKDKELAPSRGDIFPEVLTAQDKSRTEMSCTELNVHEPQHIVTNMLAANLLLAKTCALITDDTIPELGLASFNALELTSIFRPYRAEEPAASKDEKEVKKSVRKRSAKKTA